MTRPLAPSSNDIDPVFDDWVIEVLGVDPASYSDPYDGGAAPRPGSPAAGSHGQVSPAGRSHAPGSPPPKQPDDGGPTYSGFGAGLSELRGGSPAAPGNGAVTPEVATELLRNITEGKPPFRPDLGKVGPVSWFVTGGSPHVGAGAGKSVEIPVEVKNPTGKPPLRFAEADLVQILDKKLPAARKLAEAQVRADRGVPEGKPLTGSMKRSAEYKARGIAERQMWTEVGERVAASESGVGKVELKDSAFSRQGDGEFTLTSRPEAVQVKGGPEALLKIVMETGVPVEKPVLEAAEALAAKAKWGGRVRGAFRVGGKVLIVVGVAMDTYKIITAQDKVKAVAEVAGGWTAATIAGTAFAEAFAPADFAGPLAWAAHGVGTLVVGGVAYYLGSGAAKTIYELTVEGLPITVGGGT